MSELVERIRKAQKRPVYKSLDEELLSVLKMEVGHFSPHTEAARKEAEEVKRLMQLDMIKKAVKKWGI